MQKDQPVTSLREASRQFVRELGFLDQALPGLKVSHSQAHALIEIEQNGMMTAKELADVLNLDKSTLSRAIEQLNTKGWIKKMTDRSDRRKKPLILTDKGRHRVVKIHEYANRQVRDALALLSKSEQETVFRGMRLYAKALSRLRKQSEFSIRSMKSSDNPWVAQIIHKVMPAYGADGPGFALSDPEVSNMYKAYQKHGAGYLVVERHGKVVGGAGFASLESGPSNICELRKMYFLPETRGLGLGRCLLEKVLDAAAHAGYRKCYLETLCHMSHARQLYESVGFRRLKGPMGSTGHFGCDAWYLKKL